MFLVKKVSKTKGFNGAIKFDMKGNRQAVKKYCGADVVCRNVRGVKKLGMRVEVVTLVIPGVNDSDDCLKEIVNRHLKETGPGTITFHAVLSYLSTER